LRDWLREVDLLIWGGGNLVQQSSLFYFPRQVIPALMAQWARVPVICFGTGVEEIRSRVLRRLARHAFDRVFDDILVRGSRSATHLRQMGVSKSIRVIPDQAIALRPAPREQAEIFLQGIGLSRHQGPVVSISVKPTFIYRGGLLPVSIDPPSPGRMYRQRRRHALEEAFRGLTRHLLDLGVLVMLVPMFHDQGDLDACERVAAGFPQDSVKVLTQVPGPRLLKAVLGLMDAHVGIRLHSCILASSMGVATLGVQYMTKHLDYFEMLGMERFVIQESEVTKRKLIDQFDTLWSQRDQVRDALILRVKTLEGRLTAEVDAALGSFEKRYRVASG
jgi:polysaccharide pyruvyl transferase WcaK-like protein